MPGVAQPRLARATAMKAATTLRKSKIENDFIAVYSEGNALKKR